MEKITDLKTEPIIGKFYLVPCVYVDNLSVWLPVIGEPHMDVDLGVTWKHFHYDVRFMQVEYLDVSARFDRDVATLGNPLNIEQIEQPINIEYRRLMCRRLMPEFPAFPRSESYQAMHRKYVGKSIKCGRCPHRNMPLESLPQDNNGNVVCNGHGLLISMREKKVIQRF